MGQTMNSNKNSSSKNKCCQSSAAGYASPMAAFRNGPREQLLFVTCPSVDSTQPDLLATICVDPESPEYCKVISSLEMPNCGDEIHHTGWNICSSCHGQPGARPRSHLMLPCLNSSRIYAVDLTDPRAPRLEKTVEAAELAQLGVSFPHTAHCLADGTIMVSTLGDTEGGERGDFVLLDGANFSLLRRWPAQDRVVPFNYDFWYQPRRGLMLSTEWGRPKSIKAGFKMSDVVKGSYGHSVHVWDWQKHEHIQTIELPSPEGLVPLEVRFLHEPTQAHAFVGTALGSAIFHFWREEQGPGPMHHELVASVPNKRVSGWAMESMPALITDIMVSMDDRFLYASCWLHGDIRQYDISDPGKPVLVGQCFVGGSIHSESGVKVLEDAELKSQPAQLHVQGRAVEGGPQMMQLSLDGRRLYVTNSLYSVWDSEFYPKMLSQGSTMLQLDVDIERGGLAVNPNFRVDFARSEQLPKGPYLAHEMRYPGGDCTSDIWL